MSDRREQIVPLTPLGGRSSARGARLAAAGVLGASALLVGARILGRLAEPSHDPTPSASPDPRATQGVDAADATESVAVSMQAAGYSVRYATDSGHRPVVLDNGSLAVFGFGPPTAAGEYDGTIQVSVGTPARAAAVMGTSGPTGVFGA